MNVPKIRNGKKQQKFVPTLNMWNALEASFDIEGKPTIEAIMARSGSNRSNWYKWQHTPGFYEWWAEEWRKHMRESEWWMDKVCKVKAMKDYRYMELLQTKYYNFAKKFGTDITSNGQTIFNINNVPADNPLKDL